MEEVLQHGIGVGLEASALGRSRDFGGSVAGLLSPNGFYHFLAARARGFDPFVTGGYTAFIRNDIRNGLNVGVGTNYWFRPHTAIRLEARDTIEPSRSGLPAAANLSNRTSQYWSVKIGIVF